MPPFFPLIHLKKSFDYRDEDGGLVLATERKLLINNLLAMFACYWRRKLHKMGEMPVRGAHGCNYSQVSAVWLAFARACLLVWSDLYVLYFVCEPFWHFFGADEFCFFMFYRVFYFFLVVEISHDFVAVVVYFFMFPCCFGNYCHSSKSRNQLV